jgi:hypothetical protein
LFCEERYFGQLASVISMPKNFGKKLTRYHYLPILDDRNINDHPTGSLYVAIIFPYFYLINLSYCFLKSSSDSSKGLGAFWEEVNKIPLLTYFR